MLLIWRACALGRNARSRHLPSAICAIHIRSAPRSQTWQLGLRLQSARRAAAAEPATRRRGDPHAASSPMPFASHDWWAGNRMVPAAPSQPGLPGGPWTNRARLGSGGWVGNSLGEGDCSGEARIFSCASYYFRMSAFLQKSAFPIAASKARWRRRRQYRSRSCVGTARTLRGETPNSFLKQVAKEL